MTNPNSIETNEKTNVPEIYNSCRSIGAGMEDLVQNEMTPISLRDYAKYSLETNETLKLPVGIVREGIVIFPGEKTLLVRENPLLNLDESLAYEREFLQYMDSVKEKIAREFPKGKELTNEEFNKKMHLTYFGKNFFAYQPHQTNLENYLSKAEEDGRKSPEDRRVLEIDYSTLGRDGEYTSSRLMPLDKLEQDDIFRWCFRDMAQEWAERIRTSFGFENSYVFVAGDKKIKDLFGDKPFVAPFFYSPTENGEFGFKPGEKYSIKGKWIAKRKPD
jgi:hypothetical protein